MRKYLTLATLNLQYAFIYRGPLLIWVIGGLVTILAISSVWQSSTGADLLGGYSRQQLVSYYVLGFLLQWLTGLQPFSNVRDDIKNGEITQKSLTKPISYFGANLSGEISWHTVSLIFASLALLISAPVLGLQFSFSTSLFQLIFLTGSIFLAALISFTFCMWLGLLNFWYSEADNFYRVLYWGGIGLFGGQIIPLSFVPSQISGLVRLLPFRYLFSFPLEIYFSGLTIREEIGGFFCGLVWLTLFIVIYKILWKHGVKTYSAFGG